MPDLSPETIDRLVEAASEVRKKAHAPYSSFAVGAAVLDTDAERHAVAAAVSASGQEIEGLAVVTDTSPPTSPCGACRQVLVEFGDFPVILANLQGERIVTSVGDLLPDAFTPESLVKG